MGEPSGGDDADVPGAPRDHPGEVLAEGEAARGRRLGRDEAVDPDRDERSHGPRAVHGHDRAEEGVVDWRLPRQRQVEAGAEPVFEDPVRQLLVQGVALRHAVEDLVERLRLVLNHPVDVTADPDADRRHRVEGERVEVVVGDDDQRIGTVREQRVAELPDLGHARLDLASTAQAARRLVVVGIEHVRHRGGEHDLAHHASPSPGCPSPPWLPSRPGVGRCGHPAG